MGRRGPILLEPDLPYTTPVRDLSKGWPLFGRLFRRESSPARVVPAIPPPPSRPAGVSQLPRPAIRWVGTGGRIALRSFEWQADSNYVCSWQEETYGINFRDFRFTPEFADAFRHDLRRAALDINHGLFMLDDGAPCGFLWLVICQNSWTNERYGYVNNLFVVNSRRGQGLGEDLMNYADDWFRRRRISRIRLTVTVENDAACRLYERLGYEVKRWEMEKDIEL